MCRFVEGEDRRQPALLPSCLDDYVGEDNPARVVDIFVDELDFEGLGLAVTPAATGRPAYHAATLVKLYIYGYLNRVSSSPRLEREALRNVELVWLTGKFSPDHKTLQRLPMYASAENPRSASATVGNILLAVGLLKIHTE